MDTHHHTENLQARSRSCGFSFLFALVAFFDAWAMRFRELAALPPLF